VRASELAIHPLPQKFPRNKTTDLLHISQSAISRHMAQLEDELRRKASGAGHYALCGRISGNRRACVGSAYHMKGAYATTQLFQEKLKKSGVADKVELSASFCMGECKDGPCVRIDGVKFHHVDQDRVASLVQEEIVPRANA